MPYAQFVTNDGLHLNDFGQKCIGKLLSMSILDAVNPKQLTGAPKLPHTEAFRPREGQCHEAPVRRPVDLSRERRHLRSAAVRAEDPVSQAREHGGPDRRLLSRPQEGRPARRRGLGGRERQSLDPQRHPSRRALSLPSDDEQGRARHHHRRGAARLVLPARREARLPRQARRPRHHREGSRGRAEAHRPRAAAARDRRRQHARGLALRQRRLRERGLRHGLRRHHVPARDAASASPAPTPGAGTRRSTSPPRTGRRTTTRRSSGKATRRAATSATAISRSCTISRRCPATASPSPASRTRSAAPRRAGRARWRSSRTEFTASRSA